MNKRKKGKYIISGVLSGLAVVYLTGAFALPLEGLEYRFWVEGIGKCLCVFVLPLWFVGLLYGRLRQCLRDRIAKKWAERWSAGLLGLVTVVFCFNWCCFALIYVIFSFREEHYLGNGLLSVVVESFPKAAKYDIYESVGLFLRRKTDFTPEAAADYLSERYGREFYSMEENGEIYCIDADREEVRTAVRYTGGELQDTYPQAVADYYLAEGYRVLGLNWDVSSIETNLYGDIFCLILDEEKNAAAFGADVYRLMQHALEREPFLKQYNVYIGISIKEHEDQWEIEGFGNSRPWERISAGYYRDDESKVVQAVIWDVDVMNIQAWKAALAADARRESSAGSDSAAGSKPSANPDSAAGSEPSAGSDSAAGSEPSAGSDSAAGSEPSAGSDSAAGSEPSANPDSAAGSKPQAGSNPSAEPAPEPTTREMAEGEYPEQCRAAEAIWEAELKDSGYEYEPGFNAKGNLVIWLGKLPADKLQSTTEESDYYLTYDRESKNGNCYLFVLSEVPEGYGLNDAFLREFYACEKDTLTVAVGNKTSWSQTGSEEYRELTGE